MVLFEKKVNEYQQSNWQMICYNLSYGTDIHFNLYISFNYSIYVHIIHLHFFKHCK